MCSCQQQNERASVYNNDKTRDEERPMEKIAHPVEGLIVRDASGRISFAIGMGEDARAKALASDPAWLSEARAKRLQPLIIDRRKYTVLVVTMEKGELLLFCRVPGDAVLEFVSSVDFAYDIIEHFLTDPFEAMTVVDRKANLVYISPVHEQFFGLSHGEANGRPVREVIENTRLHKVVASGKAEVGEIQEMRGLQRVVSRVPICRDGAVLGAVGRVMFKGPKQIEELSRRANALESEVAFFRREAMSLRSRSYGLDDLIGDSPAMKRLRDEIVKIAPLDLPVMIRGESGTGKELVAHSLHRLSGRRDAKLVMVNAGALPTNLVESELFGYEAGAFTGADRKGRRGKFEQAAQGTIFLDEIGDMPIDVQVKLLRVLQERTIERIGGEQSIEVDFRLITASNKDLQQLVAEQKFRLDLYYRVSAISIEVPPLRRRLDDIPLLVAHFLKDFAQRHAVPVPEVDEDALSYLMDQSWPGNVRQLRHEVERALVFAEQGRITIDTFTKYGDLRPPDLAPSGPGPIPDAHDAASSLKEAKEQVEMKLVRSALDRYHGNKKRVAQELGISRSYLYKILGEPEA
jgi:PAS domain S-box-containing protein